MAETLPRKTKIVYGFGDLGNSIAYTIIGFFYLFYLTDVAGISPGIAGTIMLIGKIWDAVVDPFIGHASDHLKSPLGRRRPFFLLYSLPFAIFFYLLWNVPDVGYLWKIAYVSGSFLIFITFFSLIQIPYSSLTAQLTEDYDERTRLTAYRMAFSIIGGLVCAVLPIEIVHAFADPQTGFRAMGLVFALVIFLSPAALFLWIRERPKQQKVEKFSFFKGLREVFRNRPFIFALLMFLFTWGAVDVISAMMIYYIKYWLNMESQTSVLLGLVFVTAVVFLPFWNWVCSRLGKKTSYILSSLLMILVFLSLLFLPQDDRFWVYILCFFGGVGISAAHIIPWSILPDVIEWDEIKTGKRREGIYSGFSSFLHQLSASGAMFLIGIVLELAGYVPNSEQARRSLFAIRFLLGPVPAILFLGGIIAILFYPINAEMHRRMKSILSKKRARYAVSD